VVAHRMTDAAVAVQLATAVGAAGLARPAGDRGDGAPGHGAPGHGAPGHAAPGHAAPGHRALPGPEPAADAAAGAALTALREGEFLLAVKDPRRLVWPAQLVRARVPSVTRDRRPAAAPRPALAGARDGEGP
jgi:hypothetical protein